MTRSPSRAFCLTQSAASSRLFTRTEPGIWAASFALVMLGSLGSRLPMMGVSTVIKIHSLIQFLLCEYIDRSSCYGELIKAYATALFLELVNVIH